MRKFSWIFIFTALTAFVFFADGCNLKNEINRAGKETDPFDQQIEDLPLAGLTEAMPGLCTPTVLSFNLLMTGQSWWQTAKDHLDSVTVDEMDYKISSNHSTSQATIYLYLSDVTNISQVSDADYLGSTDPIPAGQNVGDWTALALKPGAEKRLEKLVMNPDTQFTICARVPEVVDGSINPGAVNLKLGLQVSGSATFVPIGN